jgi:hypothetical protein
MIFAMTGDQSEEIVKVIASYPFCGLFDRITKK